MTNELKNANVSIEYREADKQIFAKDLTDKFNEPACYTTSKRGLPKAWKLIVAAFDDNTTHRDVMNMMKEQNIKYHYWCMMD